MKRGRWDGDGNVCRFKKTRTRGDASPRESLALLSTNPRCPVGSSNRGPLQRSQGRQALSLSIAFTPLATCVLTSFPAFSRIPAELTLRPILFACLVGGSVTFVSLDRLMFVTWKRIVLSETRDTYTPKLCFVDIDIVFKGRSESN